MLIQANFDSKVIGRPLDHRVLLPPGTDPSSVPPGLPFILHLHGADSSSASLATAEPRYEAAWASGDLPPAVIGCVSCATRGGFYLDHVGGEAWETVIRDEFPALIEAQFATSPAPRAALGASMGGFGALLLVMREPERWTVASAMSPVVFPAERHEAALPFAPGILGELNDALAGGDPGDAATYVANTVHGRARANVEAIRRAAPAIAIDVGAADEYGLADGAESLHALLRELGIAHTFRSVAHGRHHDALADLRAYDAIRDLGRALRSKLEA